MSLSLRNVDVSGLLYRVPLPVLVLVLAVLALILIGVLSRVSAIVQGKGTVGDYVLLAVVSVFLILLAVIVLGAVHGNYHLL